MSNFLVKVGVNAVALWVASLVVSGVHLGDDADRVSSRILTIVIVAAIFGVVNAIVKPIAMILSIPAIILTIGLFTFVVNALMLQITAWIAKPLGLDFSLDNFFWSAVFAAVVITLVSLLANMLLPEHADRR